MLEIQELYFLGALQQSTQPSRINYNYNSIQCKNDLNICQFYATHFPCFLLGTVVRSTLRQNTTQKNARMATDKFCITQRMAASICLVGKI